MKKTISVLRVSITLIIMLLLIAITHAQNKVGNSENWECGDALIFENQSHSTVPIFDQCWMAENLNVGEMIPGSDEQTDNSKIEKHCYDNNPDNCKIYGGLYQWNEMMQYSNKESSQGICPVGWHVPSNEDWIKLEMNLGIPQEEIKFIERGSNQASQLAGNKNLWEDGLLNQDSSFDNLGFSALPSGNTDVLGDFYQEFKATHFWSSTERKINDSALYRRIKYDSPKMFGYSHYKGLSFSVRCIKD